MGYANHQGSQRYATIGTVIGLHLLVGMVLVKTFTPEIFDHFVQPNPDATSVFTPTPTPTVDPTDTTPDPQPTSTVYTPETPFPLPTTGPTFTPTDENTGEVVVDPKPVPTTTPLPYVPPRPLFTAKGPVPTNGPKGWVNNIDYPSIAIKREEQGLSGIRLVVSSAGRVEACQVTRTSGSQALDDAACKLVAKRARFKPAIDGNGAAVVGTYATSINWVLPD